MKTKTQIDIELELANAREKHHVFVANEAAGSISLYPAKSV